MYLKNSEKRCKNSDQRKTGVTEI